MKTVTALALAALLLFSLGGCGDDDEDDAAQARTVACRGYQLDTDGELALAVGLMRTAEVDGEWDNAQLSEPVARLGAAAVKAGNVVGLSDADFAVFLGLATAARDADRRINPNGTTDIGLSDAAAALDAAAAEVDTLCG